jgi:hypothetical protein
MLKSRLHCFDHGLVVGKFRPVGLLPVPHCIAFAQNYIDQLLA